VGESVGEKKLFISRERKQFIYREDRERAGCRGWGIVGPTALRSRLMEYTRKRRCERGARKVVPQGEEYAALSQRPDKEEGEGADDSCGDERLDRPWKGAPASAREVL
jgi:hypothetical protein